MSFTMRNVLLTVHILMVAAWLGADFLRYVLRPRIAREGGPAVLAWARQQAWMHDRYYATVAVVLLATGIGLVLDGPYTRSSDFIWVGVGAIVLGATVGGGGLGSLSKRHVAALESGDDSGAAALERKMLPLDVLLTVAAVLAVIAMVGKWHA